MIRAIESAYDYATEKQITVWAVIRESPEYFKVPKHLWCILTDGLIEKLLIRGIFDFESNQTMV
ncbi:MAG: hypothetical protein VYA34_14120 [Myxococcota bacterium]|nr:hypothetical protein [Myxococcota bacterium]